MGKRVLITGGSGFVGKNLIEYLNEKYPGEYIIDAPRSAELNVVSKESVDKWFDTHERYDDVIHLAVYTDAVDKNKDGSKMIEYNLKSFLNFYYHSKDYGRMFYSGSGAEFDKSEDIVSVKENQLGERIPHDGYGLMKYAIANIIEDSTNIYNIRIFGLFGKYEYSFRFITEMIHNSILGKPFNIRQNVVFDYLYIDEFVSMVACLLRVDKPKYHSYNMVSGEKIDLLSLCELINRVAIKYGKLKQQITVYNEGLNNEYTASNERFIGEFGNASEYNKCPIEEAVDRLYKIYLDFNNEEKQ